MASPFLPSDADIRVDQLVGAISEASTALRVPDLLEVRSLAVLTTEGWRHASSLIRVGFDQGEGAGAFDVIRAGPALIVRRVLPASDIKSVDALLRAFSIWSSEVNATDLPDFQESNRLSRAGSGEVWGPWPAWTISLHDKRGRWSGNTPRGPFYDPAAMVFASSFGELIGKWVGDPHEREASSLPNSYRVTIRDRRARFTKVAVEEQRDAASAVVTVLADVHDTSCDVAAVRTDYQGARDTIVGRLEDGRASIEIGTPLRMLEAVLLDRQTGDWIDRIHDRAMNRTASGDSGKTERLLSEDVAAGESETVEFKPLINLDRTDPKSYELLKVVCAFANSNGGRLYLGISDDAEVVGLERDLYRLKTTFGDGPAGKLRTKYEVALRRMVNEGISPAAVTDYAWIEHSGHSVLQVSVASGPSGPYQVVEDGQYWHRRGASCRRGLPERFLAREKADANRSWPFIS